MIHWSGGIHCRSPRAGSRQPANRRTGTTPRLELSDEPPVEPVVWRDKQPFCHQNRVPITGECGGERSSRQRPCLVWKFVGLGLEGINYGWLSRGNTGEHPLQARWRRLLPLSGIQRNLAVGGTESGASQTTQLADQQKVRGGDTGPLKHRSGSGVPIDSQDRLNGQHVTATERRSPRQAPI
jgi:hypothetical protein